MGSKLASLALIALLVTPAGAGEVHRRLRISAAIGGANGLDEENSDSANVLTLVDDQFGFVDQFIDPRDDNAQFGSLELRPGTLLTLAGQYALTRTVVLEVSVGYQFTDLGDVEAQVHFAPPGTGAIDEFDFQVFRLSAGDVTRVPIAVTGLKRFRPEARFHPYLGVGLGYSFVGFDASPELDRLSVNLDASRGGPARLTSEGLLGARLETPNPADVDELDGATVVTNDTFEWHLAAGAEYGFGPRWAGYVDLRYQVAANSVEIGFNGGQDLGWAVPQASVRENSDAATAFYGAMLIVQGGLFDADGDGAPDTGFSYIQGAKLDLDRITLQLGVRYTLGGDR